jgi:hypothetical protein
MSIIQINTAYGRGFLGFKGAPITYTTELGIVMLKVWFPEKERWINFRASSLEEIIPKDLTIASRATYVHGESKETYSSLG